MSKNGLSWFDIMTKRMLKTMTDCIRAHEASSHNILHQHMPSKEHVLVVIGDAYLLSSEFHEFLKNSVIAVPLAL